MTNPDSLPVETSLMRIISQGLVPATASSNPVEVVRRMLATQGQMTSAVPHSLIVRTEAATGRDVKDAFESGQLVRSWPFRGTLHITTAEDHHWLRALWVSRRDTWWAKVSAAYGLDEGHLERLRQVTAEFLSDGPKRRSEVKSLWETEGVAPQISDQRAQLDQVLIVQLHRDGAMVSGPLRGNEHLLLSAQRLPGNSTDLVAAIEAGDEAALRASYAEVARRYALAHGPVSASDFSRWTGAGIVVARRALADAVKLSRNERPAHPDLTVAASDQVPLAAAHFEGGSLVHGPGRSPREVTYYLRSDLWDVLEANRVDAKKTMYLSMFDELHVGYKDRSCLTDAAGEKLICPGGNGMFRPLVVDRGRMVAVNPKNLGFQWYGKPTKRLERDTDQAIREVLQRLGQ